MLFKHFELRSEFNLHAEDNNIVVHIIDEEFENVLHVGNIIIKVLFNLVNNVLKI